MRKKKKKLNYSLYTAQCPKWKKYVWWLLTTSVGENVEKLERLCIHCWWDCTGAAAVENSMVAPDKVKHRITMWSSSSTPRHRPKRTESKDSNWYLYTGVHSSVIQNSHMLETTQMSTKEGTDKPQNMVHPHSGMLLSLKKEGKSSTGYSMDEPFRHHAQWNKPDTTGQYCVILPVWGAYSIQIHRDESRVVSRGWGRGEGRWCWVGTEFLLKVVRKFCVRSGDGHTTLWMYLMTLNCTLTNIKC